MFHIINARWIVDGLALILSVLMAARAYLQARREEKVAFRKCFGPEYDRDLLRQSSRCDDVNPYDRQARLKAFKIRDPGVTERYSKGGGTMAQPSGIATGIDPGVIHAATMEGSSPQSPSYSHVSSKQ